MNDPLDILAERMGIESEYRDVRGETIRASAETKRALLAAMGVRVADSADVKAALDAIEAEEWRHALPPVQVLYAGATDASIELGLPKGTGEVRWSIALEDGGESTGKVEFGKLSSLAGTERDGVRMERRALPLPSDLPWGYHRLSVDPGDATATLIVTPGRCWLPDAVSDGGRVWGLAAQLYLLRSGKDWGIGDFGDLRALVGIAASRGASVIGLNPLHALFTDNPEAASPYSPQAVCC